MRENFKPTRLYIKELHGLKYFGKSIKIDNIIFDSIPKVVAHFSVSNYTIVC